MSSLARKTLIYEWRRFLPAALAVGFTGLLLILQAALVEGIFGSASVHITASAADIWLGYPGTSSIDQGRAINPDLNSLLLADPQVRRTEPLIWVDGEWRGERKGGISVIVSGIDPSKDGLMFARTLTPAQRERLFFPGGVIVDRADLDKLGAVVGQSANINGERVRVVDVATGLRALGGVNVITSLATARSLSHDSGPTYLVAAVTDPEKAEEVALRVSGHAGFGPYEVWTAREFARRTELFWLFDTGAGAGVVFLALMVFLVGVVVTSQTLVAAVVASVREYATLNALGIGIRALRWVVLEQAIWVGVLGLTMASVLSIVFTRLARSQDVPVHLELGTAITCVVLVLILAVISGLASIRGLKRADPASLLR